MAWYRDAMAINAKAVMKKKRLLNKTALEEIDTKITASVEAGLLRIEAPAEEINISFRLQDAVTVIDASNKKYLETQN